MPTAGDNPALQYYLGRFSRLHTDRNRHTWTAATDFRAPHKMLLLLSVLDLTGDGTISVNYIELTPDLLDRFAGYWSAVVPLGRRGDISKPFFHLKSGGFWTLIPIPGREPILEAMRTPHSMRELVDNIAGARLDEELFELARLVDARDQLRRILLEYFALDLRQRLVEYMILAQKATDYSRLLTDAALQEVHVAESVAEAVSTDERVRDQGFRRAVVGAYSHRCAVCGIRMLTPQGHTAVDAAHIVPWSESHNDDIRNGLALCKLCHWAFDEFLISATDRYRVLTSPLLSANHNLPGHLAQFEGRELWVPEDHVFQPAPEHLASHRHQFLSH